MTWTVEALNDGHKLDGLDCGNDDITAWLRHHAHHAVRQGTRTYVAVGSENSVVGYFSLAPHLIERNDVTRSLGRGAPRQIPAILLAKLAIDRRTQGRGFGSELLIVALTTIIEAARAAGGKLVVVDAIDEAAAEFYKRHDFIPVPHNQLRLVQKLSTIAAVLGVPWP